jgi:hypothetical protein
VKVFVHNSRQQERPHFLDPLYDVRAAGQHVGDHLNPGERGYDVSGQGCRVHRGPDLPFLPALIRQVFHRGDPVFVRLPHGLTECCCFKGEPDAGFDYRFADQMESEHPAHEDHGRQGRPALRKDRFTVRDDDPVLLLDDGPGQVFFGLEMKVEGSLGHLRRIGDLGQAGAAVTVLLKDHSRTGNDRLTGCLGTILKDHR